ncbi:MAG: long-chain fatty acid--CoA ligase [Candidatus Bathyarchaeota archaeon]|nr:long-chain fatty acid--CoA ligase [Candidatus Bathyarchaeota archaeon]
MQIEKQPWLRSWPPDVPRKLEYPKVPLQGFLEKAAEVSPQKAAIAFAEREITYAELDALADQFAAALVALGVKKGDRVAVFLPNTLQFIIAYYGSLKVGALLTAISPLHREREVEYQLKDAEAETIVALDTLYPIVENVRRKTKLKNIIVTSADEYTNKTSAAPISIEKPNVYRFQELLSEGKKAKPPKVHIDPEEDLAALQYTGGTTGTAKGAMLTHMNLVSNTVAFAAWIKGSGKDTFLAALPLFHIYGMTTSMNVPVYLAAKMVLLPRFEPVTALEAIQRHRVTVFCGVPTMYSLLLANPALGNFDLTSIRVCISGASPLPPQVQKRFMEVTGGFLAEGYGLTEASPVSHCNPVDKTMRTVRLGSIGLPLPDTDARIVDVETGEKTLEAGETGELAVKGPQVMKGYWRRPEETARVLRGGWLLTGDIARMDEDGYFYITDRKKDLIKYKDYSVYPRELEDVLYEHPAVRLCAVVGKPDPLVGEIPKAFIVLKDGAKASETEIMEFVKEKVAPYKMIREVEFRKELPISAAGKVLRRMLQEEEKQKLANKS